MKSKFTLLLGAMMLTLSVFAQAPNGFNYQAAVRNSSGAAIANQNVSFRFTIRETTPTGTVIYQETQTKMSNALGLVSTIVGTGTTVTGTYPTLTQLSTGIKYFQVEMDATGGTNYIDMGTTQIVSVMYANYANGSGSLSPTATINPNQISVSGATNGQVLKWNGSVWAPSNDIGGGTGDNWGTQAVVTDNSLSGSGITGNALKLAQNGATTGQILKWNGTAWAPATESAGSDNWGTQTVQTDASLSGNGTSSNTLKLGQNGATSGQVLKWNGSAWAPATDNGGSYTGGTGITITGANVINTPWTVNGTHIHNNNTDNVGIGNTSPTERLDVSSSASNNAVVSRTGLSTGTASFKAISANASNLEMTKYSSASSGTMNSWAVSNLGLLNNNSSGALMLTTADSIGFATNSRNAMTIRKSGEVMINGSNTNSNTGYLTVIQPTYSSSKPTIEISGTNAFLAYRDGSTTKATIQSFGNNLNVNSNTGHVKLLTNSIERMHIDFTSGNVGVNTTNPLAKFQSVGPGTAFTSNGFNFNGANMGYCDTTTTTTNFSGGVVGLARGSSNLNAGLVGLGGFNATINTGAAFFARQTLSGTRRNYGTYTDVIGANGFAIGHYLDMEATNSSSSGSFGVFSGLSGTTAYDAFSGYFANEITNSADNIAILGYAANGANNYAGYFVGDVEVTGNLSKSGGTFKIDHPQDPENKYLIHSFVESPEMMNIYNGNITTDAQGFATVTMPSYFQALNIDFRYQLTVMGSVFANAIVYQKIEGNQFIIQTNVPNVEVSWQVTGVRNDAWAKANPIIVEKPKDNKDKGKYLTPELFGKPKSEGIMYIDTKGAKITN